MNTKDLVIGNIKLKCLVVGRAGTGKTSFAGTFPKPYFFDFDKGMLSLRGKNVEYDTYEDFAKFVSEWRKKIVDPQYETLVVDSVSSLVEYCQEYVKKLNGKTDMSLPMWGVMIDQLQALFLSMGKVNKHVVLTAHEQTVQDGITGEILVLPLVVGKQLPSQIGMFFDEVYRTQVGKDKDGNPVYQLITRGDTRFAAKSRLGVLDTKEVPNFSAIMAKIKGV